MGLPVTLLSNSKFFYDCEALKDREPRRCPYCPQKIEWRDYSEWLDNENESSCISNQTIEKQREEITEWDYQ